MILEATALRTGGLCLPCKNGAKPSPDQSTHLEVSCAVPSDVSPEPVFHTTARDLLEALRSTQPVGGSTYPTNQELFSQLALLEHAILYRVQVRLHDDRWGRTGCALLHLFEEEKATMTIGSRRLRFSEVSKETWTQESGPLRSHGGFLYRDSDGNVVHKCGTWRS